VNCLSLDCHVTVTDSDNTLPRQMSPDVLSALQGVRFIAQHMKDADKDNEVSTSLWFVRNFHLDY
jgi:nicotinic acetylcholine receptor